MFPTRYVRPLLGLDFLEWDFSKQIYHPGVDFNNGAAWDDYGQEVYAVKAGIVEYVHDEISSSGGFGKFVVLRHPGEMYTRYAHLKDISVKEVGQRIAEGVIVGHLGNSGSEAPPHLHFEVFNEKMANLQKKNWRSWRYYPSKKAKQFILEHYVDPWTWLKTESEQGIFEDARKWAMDNHISNGERPSDTLTREEMWQMLKNYNLRFGKGNVFRFNDED